jgi:hypothetical protein
MNRLLLVGFTTLEAGKLVSSLTLLKVAFFITVVCKVKSHLYIDKFIYIYYNMSIINNITIIR